MTAAPARDAWWAIALELLDTGRGVAIATVIGVAGSTPRHLGARMIVADDGEQHGTIGGGRIEHVTTSAAREVAGGAPPRTIRQHLVRDLAMCCGGSMEIALTPAAPSRAVLERLRDEPDAELALETPIDGDPMTLRPVRAGDPSAERPVVIADALVQVFGRGERAIVFGCGHVARAVVPLLSNLGLEVIVCDENEECAGVWADAAGSARTIRTIESFDVIEVERLIGGFTERDRLIIITRDHAVDQKILEDVIGKVSALPGYLGMIGSRGKVGRFKKRLEAKGLLEGEGAARWAHLRAPIGVDVGAETPDEIAVAIAAELVAVRRRGAATVGDWRPRRAGDGET